MLFTLANAADSIFSLFLFLLVCFLSVIYPNINQAAAMCGVPVNAAPDMTGLGGKARMVTTTVAESSVGESKHSSENKEVVKPAENLLLEVSC